MAERDVPVTQLATHIPKDLQRRLKLHCVTHDIAVMHFVVQAIEQKLGRKARRKKRAIELLAPVRTEPSLA